MSFREFASDRVNIAFVVAMSFAIAAVVCGFATHGAAITLLLGLIACVAVGVGAALANR